MAPPSSSVLGVPPPSVYPPTGSFWSTLTCWMFMPKIIGAGQSELGAHHDAASAAPIHHRDDRVRCSTSGPTRKAADIQALVLNLARDNPG